MTKRFNPTLGLSPKADEPKYEFSIWTAIGFVVLLILAGVLLPAPAAKGLTHEVLQYQKKYHDQACEDLHRQTRSLRQWMDRYEATEALLEKERLWVVVSRLNDARNESINQYRGILQRQASAGNTQVYDTTKVCRFSTIRLQPVSLVVRH